MSLNYELLLTDGAVPTTQTYLFKLHIIMLCVIITLIRCTSKLIFQIFRFFFGHRLLRLFKDHTEQIGGCFQKQEVKKLD